MTQHTPQWIDGDREYIKRCVDSHEELWEALQKIAEGEGRYNRDPLKHAENTIEDMMGVARAAIAKAETLYPRG